MRVRAIQFSPALGNVLKNMDTHGDCIQRAIDDHCDLIIFPELSLSGYHLKDIVFDVALRPNGPEFRKLKKMSLQIDIVVGAPVEEIPGIIFNSALYFSKGKLLHHHRKVQLPNYGMFEERMIFKSGRRFESFRIGDFNAGMIICREILFPVHAYLYFLQRVDFLIGISNSPHRILKKDQFASVQLWEEMGYVYSVFYHQNYVFVNRTGFEDGMGFAGGSFFAPAGKGIVKQARFFDDDRLDFDLDLESVRKSRLAGNYLRDDDPTLIIEELKRILHA